MVDGMYLFKYGANVAVGRLRYGVAYVVFRESGNEESGFGFWI